MSGIGSIFYCIYIFFKLCYLTTPSVSRLYNVDEGIKSFLFVYREMYVLLLLFCSVHWDFPMLASFMELDPLVTLSRRRLVVTDGGSNVGQCIKVCNVCSPYCVETKCLVKESNGKYVGLFARRSALNEQTQFQIVACTVLPFSEVAVT
jgi:hypothetical protein